MAVSKRLRFEILRRDNHTCQYCGRTAPETKLTVDHVVPEALGGGDTPSNLISACADCNSGKSATPPNAAQVAQVGNDAQRWAQAMKAAAGQMMADWQSRNSAYAEFESTWSAWAAGGAAADLPEDWKDAVDRFRTAGLPMLVLHECVDRAMRAPKVRRDNIFRYMCGIAWNRVSEIQADARKCLGAEIEQAAPSAKAMPSESIEALTVGLVGGYLGERGWLDAVKAAEVSIASQDADDEDSRNPHVRAVVDYLSKLDDEHWRLRKALTSIIGQAGSIRLSRYFSFLGIPVEDDWPWVDFDMDPVTLAALGEAHATRIASELLDRLSENVREGWLAMARDHYRGAGQAVDKGPPSPLIVRTAATWARETIDEPAPLH